MKLYVRYLKEHIKTKINASKNVLEFMLHSLHDVLDQKQFNNFFSYTLSNFFAVGLY